MSDPRPVQLQTSRELALPLAASTAGWSQTFAQDAGDEAGASTPISHYFWIVRRHQWKILAFIIVCVCSTIIISSRLTRIYEAVTTVDVDRQTPSAIIGEEAMRPFLYDSDQFLATQIRLMQSDSVLRPVAMKFGLLPKGSGKDGSGPRLNQEEAPVALSNLKVTRPPNTYILQISYRSPDPQLAANVANAVAQSYIDHFYGIRFRASSSVTRFMERQVEELRANMEKSNAALVAFEKELNVVSPEEKTSILAARLLELNTEYTRAQAERIRKEAAANALKSGGLEAAQASTQGETLRKISEQVEEAQAKLAQVRVVYGPNHPEFRKAQIQVTETQRMFEKAKQSVSDRVDSEYQEAVNRENILATAVSDVKKEADGLANRSIEYRQLKQEAEANKVLYDELVKKIREAGINSGFQGSTVRLADMARPTFNPVYPNTKLNALLALLLSTLLGIGAAVASDVIDNTVRDPEVVLRTLNTQTVGALPKIKNWQGRTLALLPAAPGDTGRAKGKDKDHHVTRYEEAVRTLRDSILLSDLERRPKSLLLTSAIPGEGKSTTSIHLALAHASQARRTLLIDGDLRRPTVHSRLKLTVNTGLTDVVTDGGDWKNAVVKEVVYPHLDVLPAGHASRRVADRLGDTLGGILKDAESMYDLVIVDAPPVLGFAEPLQMATLVDGVVVLAVAGQTDRKAVASALNTLRRLRVNLIGLILNEVHGNVSDGYYYYYYGYYNKYQRYYSKMKD